MAKKAIARTTLSVPCSISDNQATKAKEKGKAKERDVVAAERVIGVTGMVEAKAREVRRTVGPGSRKATAITVKYTYTHVYLVAQMCVVKVVTRVGAH